MEARVGVFHCHDCVLAWPTCVQAAPRLGLRASTTEIASGDPLDLKKTACLLLET